MLQAIANAYTCHTRTNGNIKLPLVRSLSSFYGLTLLLEPMHIQIAFVHETDFSSETSVSLDALRHDALALHSSKPMAVQGELCLGLRAYLHALGELSLGWFGRLMFQLENV